MMTKADEQKMFKRISNLEKQVADLHGKLENNKLEKHVYTVRETAEILGVTIQAVYCMINRGELETVNLGRIKILGNCLREKLGA